MAGNCKQDKCEWSPGDLIWAPRVLPEGCLGEKEILKLKQKVLGGWEVTRQDVRLCKIYIYIYMGFIGLYIAL